MIRRIIRALQKIIAVLTYIEDRDNVMAKTEYQMKIACLKTAK